MTRRWIHGQLQLFVPVGKGETWTGYAEAARRDAPAIPPTRRRRVNTPGAETARQPATFLPSPELRDWRHRAACRNTADPDMFFPPNGARTDLDSPAKRLCEGCPVQDPCREWALSSRQRFGIYGGTTRHERRRIARARAIAGGKLGAVTKDEAQQWLRRSVDDPFVVEQLEKDVYSVVVDDDDRAEIVRAALRAVADMLDEADA
jgi:WhiB family redox-sensing transcriptional regulator